MEPVIRAYNDFARKLDHLANGDGPHMNFYGKFQLEEMDRKIVLEKEKAEKRENHSGAGHHLPSVLDAEFWTFIRQLLEDYYELDLPLMDEVKIRGSNENHPIISVGPIGGFRIIA